MDQKEPEEHSLVKSKHRNQNCGLKKIVLGGPKENEARKAFRNEMKAFGRVEFALTHQKRVQEVNSTRTKAEARIKKERVRKLLILNLDFQPKRGMAMLGNQTMGLAALGLAIPQLQLLDGPFELCQPSDARCSGSWLHTVN